MEMKLMKGIFLFFLLILNDFCNAQYSFRSKFELPASDEYSLSSAELNGHYFVASCTRDFNTDFYSSIIYRITAGGFVTDSVFLDSCYVTRLLVLDGSLFAFSRKTIDWNVSESIGIRKMDDFLFTLKDTVITEPGRSYHFLDATVGPSNTCLLFSFNYDYTALSGHESELTFFNSDLQVVSSQSYPLFQFSAGNALPGLCVVPAADLVLLQGMFPYGPPIVHKIRMSDLQWLGTDTLIDPTNPFFFQEGRVLKDSLLIYQSSFYHDPYAINTHEDIGFVLVDTSFNNHRKFHYSADTTLPQRIAMRGIDIDPDGNVYLGGTLNRSAWGGSVWENHDSWCSIVKTDTSGQVHWNRNLGGDGFYVLDHFTSTSDGGVLCIGSYYDWRTEINPNRDLVIWKLDASGTLEFNTVFQVPAPPFEIFPNPSSDFCFIQINPDLIWEQSSLELIDPNGKVIVSRKLNSTKEYFELSNFSTGVYFVRLLMDGKATYRKLIIRN